MVVNLPPELSEYVTHQLQAGTYASAEELLSAAVRALQQAESDPSEDLILEDDEALDEFFNELRNAIRTKATPQP